MQRDPRDKRVPFMMSEAELQAVDDWRFENRVATRAEALRQLVKIALEAEKPTRFARLRSMLKHTNIQWQLNIFTKLEKSYEKDIARLEEEIDDYYILEEKLDDEGDEIEAKEARAYADLFEKHLKLSKVELEKIRTEQARLTALLPPKKDSEQ